MTHWRLTRVINAAGTMTSIGASRARPQVKAAVDAILDEFVSIDELQQRACGVIARLTGAEAGCVAHCSAAGIATAVAACLTGSDLARIERLPETAGDEARIAVSMGHLINYGAPVGQAIGLAGGRVVPVGTAALCETFHLRGVLEQGCAAAVYVISHHTVRQGELPLELLVEICHAHQVPVIVDAAAEYDLEGPIERGADLVIHSGHKFLGGITSGIVAGRLDLIRAVHLQQRGIGRCMKVGKEAIVGAMTALECWQQRDAAAERARQLAIIGQWRDRLGAIGGLACASHDDWTGNPVSRLRLQVDPDGSGLFAWELASRLAARSPAIAVRDDLVEHGEIYLDPCNLDADEAALVGAAIIEEIQRALRDGSGRRQRWAEVKRAREAAAFRWPEPGPGPAG